MKYTRWIPLAASVMIIFFYCRFCTPLGKKQVCFDELDDFIQDTLRNHPSMTVIDSFSHLTVFKIYPPEIYYRAIPDTFEIGPRYQMDGYPDLIDYTGDFKYSFKEMGPWILWQKLENIKNGKKYFFPFYTPRPFIVTLDEIIYPTDFITPIELDETIKYNVIKIR